MFNGVNHVVNILEKTCSSGKNDKFKRVYRSWIEPQEPKKLREKVWSRKKISNDVRRRGWFTG